MPSEKAHGAVLDTLPDHRSPAKIPVRASLLRPDNAGSERIRVRTARTAKLALAMVSIGLAACGCAAGARSYRAVETPLPPTRVVVVAPVINLSGNEEFDGLQLTDIVAAELSSFRALAVIPVNLTLAALARVGKTRVETPEDALALAREFGADATLVTAVTHYDPYVPPTLGLILQWYEPTRNAWEGSAPAPGAAELAADPAARPYMQWQVQRVFRAADERVTDEVREFAGLRDGAESPLAWRRYTHAQKHFAEFCSWSAIRTMLRQNLCDAGF